MRGFAASKAVTAEICLSSSYCSKTIRDINGICCKEVAIALIEASEREHAENGEDVIARVVRAHH